MKLQEERDLLVLTYLSQKGIRSLGEIQVDLNFGDDTGFNFDNTVNVLAEEGYLEKRMGIIPEQHESFSWEITELGKIYLNDLSLRKSDEINKKAYIIPIIIVIVIAILAFMRVFPKMFRG
jgi:hypothetical protein